MNADEKITGQPDWRRIQPGFPRVIGHRGSAERYPENTLPSFRAAVAEGADMVELDFRETADGVLVCSHDDKTARCIDLNRSSQARNRLISASTSAEVARWDAGARTHSSFAGVRIPTLEEAVREILSGGAVPVLERKSGSARRVLSLLRDLNAVGSVCVQSFDWSFLRALATAEPALALAALGKRAVPKDVLPGIRETGACIVNWEFSKLTRPAVLRLHDAGFPVWAWTVNHKSGFARAVEIGLDAVATDAPGRLRRYLDSQGDRGTS